MEKEYIINRSNDGFNLVLHTRFEIDNQLRKRIDGITGINYSSIYYKHKLRIETAYLYTNEEITAAISKVICQHLRLLELSKKDPEIRKMLND